MNTPVRPPQKRYTDEDFKGLFAGDVQLPNFEPIPHWEALRSSIWMHGKAVEQFDKSNGHGGSYKVRVRARIADKVGDAIYYLTCGQGGGYTGEGIVVMVAGYAGGPDSITTGRFAICKHEKVDAPGANHSRGWHPGWCGKCGLDMSVDSGD